jgi:hypothetical protein
MVNHTSPLPVIITLIGIRDAVSRMLPPQKMSPSTPAMAGSTITFAVLTLDVLCGGYHVRVHRCGVSSLEAVVKAWLLVCSHLLSRLSSCSICLL